MHDVLPTLPGHASPDYPGDELIIRRRPTNRGILEMGGRAGLEVALCALRLRSVDGARSLADARTPFLAMTDMVQTMSMTTHLTVRLRWGGRAEPSFVAELIAAALDEGRPGEMEYIGRNLLALFSIPGSPWTVFAVDPDDLNFPDRGDVRFIRQATVDVSTGEGQTGRLPTRFANPGYGAWDRLIAAMTSIETATDLFVTLTPTALTPAEDDQLEALRRVELDPSAGLSHLRLQATAADAIASLRSPTACLQLMLVGSSTLRESTIAAVASAITSPFDTMSANGQRLAAAPRRLLGGFVVDPARRPGYVLALIADGRPWLGTQERRIEDLVTADELSFVFCWPVGSDGTLPGIQAVANQELSARTDTSVVVGSLADGTRVHQDIRDRTQHLALLGGSGSGKTSLMVDLALQDIAARRTVVVFDAAGDMVRRLPAALGRGRRDDMVVLDTTAAVPIHSMDLLQLDRDTGRAIVFTKAVHDGLVADLPLDFHGPVGRQNLQAVLVGLSVVGHCLTDLPKVFDDPAAMEALVQALADADVVEHRQLAGVLRRLHQGSADNRAELHRWLLAKTPALTEAPGSATLGARQPTHYVDDLLQPGRIVLIRPPHDQEGSRLITSILLQVLAEATSERNFGDPPISIYLDEVQRCAGRVLRQLMNESRKRNVCIHVATQHLQNLEREADGILTNAATVLTGRMLGLQGAGLEADLDLSPRAIRQLPNLHFLGRICQDGQPVGPVHLHIEGQAPDPGEWPLWLTSSDGSN